MAKKKRKEAASNNEQSNEKLCAILSYLFIGIIWYFIDDEMKKSSFAKFHAKQGLVLLITDIIFWVVASIPFIGWILMPIFYIVLLVLLVVGIVNVANGKEKGLPIIGKFAKNFTF